MPAALNSSSITNAPLRLRHDPTARPMRHHIARLDQLVALCILFQSSDFSGRPNGCGRVLLACARQVQADAPGNASRGAPKTSRTGASPPNNPTVTNAWQMQMRVMLPGKANTAVHLDVELGIACIGRETPGRSDRGGQPKLLLILLPHARSQTAADLGGHQHVFAQ